MRSRFLQLFLLILGLLFSSSCKNSELGIKLDMKIKTLSNGLRVIMLEEHTMPLVSYQSWLRVGSVDEQPGITGISHLFEHLMFKGTPNYGPKEFFLQLEAKGAQVNAFTTRDYTAYYETFVPDLLPKVIDMEADRLSNLNLTEEALKTERQVVLEERRLQMDNSPAGKIQEALWALAFTRHPYRWPVIGVPQDVVQLSVQQLQNWYKAYYQPGNVTLVVVGDFDSDSVFTLIKKAYEKIEGRKAPQRDIPEEQEQKEERRLIIRDDVASERFAQAYHVTAASDDESYAIDVLANILFEGTSSRAYRKLVEEKDVAIGVSGSAYTPTYPGLFITSVSMKAGGASELAERLLDEVIRGVQESGVTEEEVRVAVKQLTVQLVDSVRTPYGLGQLIGTVSMILDDPYRFINDLAKYQKVTPADVKKVAQKYLIPNNRSIVVLVPEKTNR